MKTFALMLAVVIAIVAPSYAALEGGDLVVLGSIVQPHPMPNTPALLNVKPDGTIETLSADAILDEKIAYSPSSSGNVATAPNIGPVVCPDGSIVVAKAGNWNGVATPTPVAAGTPVPLNFWVQSGVYRFQPNGSMSPVAQGGLELNPNLLAPWRTDSIQGIVCDSKGNLFVSRSNYPFLPVAPPAFQPTNAIVKIAPGGAPGLFAPNTADLSNFWGMTVGSDDIIYVPQSIHSHTYGSLTTWYPSEIFQITGTSGASGAISTFATASLVSYQDSTGAVSRWSEPFDGVDFLGNDIAGNLIAQVSFYREPEGTPGSVESIASFGPGGALTTILDVWGTLGVGLLGADGEYMGVLWPGSIYALMAGSLEEEYIVYNNQKYNFGGTAYYPAEKPALSVNVSEDVFGPNGTIALGFGLTRGRTANEADLYFGIQFPDGKIQLINPNASVNGAPVLTDLTQAMRTPALIANLRYGNGTTAVKGSGTVDKLLQYSNIIIPEGTYTLLGVMTAPGANLLDVRQWLTPEPVTAKTTYSITL